MTRYMHDLLESLLVAFCKLHRIQFAAPWNPGEGGC